MPQSLSPYIRVEQVESDDAFNHVFDIRTRVFIDEQAVSQEDDYDGFDHLAHHYLAFCEQVPAGTSRWRLTPMGKVKVERFAVLESFRGKGIGKALLAAMLSDIPKGPEVYGHVQDFMQSYYENLGFVVQGDSFEEAGMPHCRMVFQPQKK